MMRKKILKITIILFCMTFVHAESEWATVSIAEQKNFIIPFTLDEENLFPSISLSIGNVPVKMGIDTSFLGTIALAYTSLILKTGGQDLLDEIWKSIKEEAMQKYSVQNPDDALMQDIIQSHKLFLTIPNVSIGRQKMGSLYANYYNAQEYYDEVKKIDGVLGLYFFFNCENIVIDYKSNCIVVNADAITGNEVPMRQFGDMAAVVVKVIINGVEQDSVVAPSFRAVYLRDMYNEKIDYSDKEIINYAKHGTPRKKTDKSKTVTVQIGDQEVSCKGYFYPRWKGDLSGEGNLAMVRKINFLGYPVFKGHRIQLDFKNWVFRMD